MFLVNPIEFRKPAGTFVVPGYWMQCVVELSKAEEMTLQQLSINHMHREPSSRTSRMFGNDWGFPRGSSASAFWSRHPSAPRNATLDQTVQNFHELRRHFADGPYARFFGAGDV
ncbi:hypothetical protein [Paraburkholderia sp. MM5384-R2]|uniref:hypothetical protein n=1 Tax=Paraburkholderia sp. MM5384-R2 TaxID=2723097 RepID=UPI002889E0C4|nr:hypothetical protein [Paraburkholderia sp. MM5384-R2]